MKFISIAAGVAIGIVVGAWLLFASVMGAIKSSTATTPTNDTMTLATVDPCAGQRAAYEAAANAWNGDAGPQEDKVRRLHEASLSCDYGSPVTLLPAHQAPDTPADPTPTLGPDQP